MTGQRVSDEQFAEWLRQRGGSWNVGMLAFDAVAADLRVAREENQRLQERIKAARDYVMTVDEENSQRSLMEAPRMISADHIEDLLGGDSND